jgi:tetratricopeptide (TPR) repeat protein
MRRYQSTIPWKGGSDGYHLPDVMFRKAEVLELAGRWKEAAAIFQGNIDWAEKKEQRNVLAENLMRLGMIKRISGDLKGAVELLEKASDLFEQLGDEDRTNRTLGTIGMILGDLHDLKKSWEYFERQGRSEDLKTRSMAANNKGVNCIKTGELDRAWVFLSEALDLFHSRGELRYESMVLNNMGLVRKNQGNLDVAEELYQKAMDIAIKIGDLEGIDRISGTIGVINKLRGRFDEARACYLRQYEISDRIGDYYGHNNALLSLGNLHTDEGRLDLALEHFEKRLALERNAGDVAGASYTLGNIGLLYNLMGEPDRAAELLEQVIAQCRTTGQRSLLATYLHELASILAVHGENEKAKKLVEESLSISTELGLAENAFNCRTLAARLLAGEDRYGALKALTELSAEAGSLARKAAVAYEVSMITEKREDVQAALALYEGLCAANPRMEWKKVLEELKAMSGNKSYRNSEE